MGYGRLDYLINNIVGAMKMEIDKVTEQEEQSLALVQARLATTIKQTIFELYKKAMVKAYALKDMELVFDDSITFEMLEDANK